MSSDDDDLDTYTQPFRAYNLARPTAKPPAVILSDSSNDDDLDNLPSQKPAVKAPSRTRRIVPGPRDSPPPRPPPSRRTKASAESVTSDTDGGSESDDPVPIKLRTKSRGEGRGEKIIMTEDEEEEDVYQAYKRKMDEDAKRRKRGKAGASTATDGAPNKRRKVGDVGATKAVAVKEKRKPGKQDVAGRDNIVGRRAPPNSESRPIYLNSGQEELISSQREDRGSIISAGTI